MSVEVTSVRLPDGGIWRVGQATDPLKSRHDTGAKPTVDESNDPGLGNRFDSPLSDYGVIYFGSQLECCFAETLSRFRAGSAAAPYRRGGSG